MRKIKTLKMNYEFKNVFERGKFYIGKQVSIYILKNKKKVNVIGIAVSTKQCGAVQRNRIKRLIRENYRLIKNDLKQGYDIVFLWSKKGEAKEADYYFIKNDILSSFKRANLLNENIWKKFYFFY